MTGNEAVLELLATGRLSVQGRVVTASNATLVGRVESGTSALPCVYKPVAGERPLWDFPDGTLAGREVAAYHISRLGGFDLVPPTVLRDGPAGPGMCQQWVEPVADEPPVDVVPAGSLEPGWLEVVRGEDPSGGEVVLAHRDEPALRAMALLDAVLNNADRKGGHVLRGEGGRVVGVDHGLCFHVEPKLRTVLWGWAGDRLTDAERTCLGRLDAGLGELDLERWLTAAEVDATAERVERLLAADRLPRPGGAWPWLPWPAF